MVPAKSIRLLGLASLGWARRAARFGRTTAKFSVHGLQQVLESSYLSSELFDFVGLRITVATVGSATSATLSASSANLSSEREESEEARIILTLGGSLCKNNSRRNESLSAVPSLSPTSCCMRRRSCVGLRSPSSSPIAELFTAK